MLLYLTEALILCTEFMTVDQLENDILSFVSPLIGEYMFKTEENYGEIWEIRQALTADKIVFCALMRLLSQTLKGMENWKELTLVKYRWFINYLKELLDYIKTQTAVSPHKLISTIFNVSKVCGIVKVIYNLSQDHIEFCFYWKWVSIYFKWFSVACSTNNFKWSRET